MAEQTHLQAARVQREALHQALVGLEDALSTPIGDAARWRLRVAMAMEHAASRVDEHIFHTEAPGGLLQRVVEEAPRLSCRADRLRADHVDLRREAVRLQGALAQIDDGEVKDRGIPIRNDALDFLGQLARHRQRGADLVYEAYQVDIGDSH